jgi:hypothetical protein
MGKLMTVRPPTPLWSLRLAALFSALVTLLATLLTAQSGTAHAATGTALRDDTGLYPRAVRLEHNGGANGRILSSVASFSGNNGLGAIYESTDSGTSFHQVGAVADPEAAGGQGLCCSTLFELPQNIGDLPVGTLLWAASVGQDETNRRMSLRVFASRDIGRTWSYLSTVATAANTGGLWEPEFSVDVSGQLVAHYSDETDSAHSQKLMAARTTNGLTWTGHHATVISPLVTDRPGMAVVRKLGNGTYFMTYEICSASGQYQCVVHYRTSPDGWDWTSGPFLGYRPETADGKYFKHAPTVAWAPEAGNPVGRLFLIGQVLYNKDGTVAAGSGRTVWVNSAGGSGAWREITAPVTVESTVVDYCPNYSSALLPSADGSKLLEIATDWVGGICKPYFATQAVPSA